MNAVLQLPHYKFSVEDYHRMGDAGVFAPDCRVELIEGEVIHMAPIGSPHMSVVNFLTAFFVRAVGDSGVVSTQNPVRLLPNSEPQPDVTVLKPRADYYRSALPQPGDVLLLIEVSDSRVDDDRRVKVPLYARYGIPELWLFDLKAERLEVYSEPKGRIFTCQQRLTPRDIVKPILFSAPDLPLREIWPAS